MASRFPRERLTVSLRRVAIEVKSQVLEELIDPAAEVERVATGFTFTEGPIWNKR